MASAVEVKVIKPSRFKDEQFFKTIKAAASAVADDMELDFTYTVSSWEHDVKFETIVSMGEKVEILVGTDDKVYGYVNDGTEPHLIFPKRGRALAFRWGGKGSYRAKTKPRRISSGPGGPSGPKVALAYVQHPGTEARDFDKTIEKKWRAPFKRRMEEALGLAAKASGHGIP